MSRIASQLRSFASPTVDVVLALFALVVVLAATAATANDLLGTPVARSTVDAAVFVLALAGTYPFVTRRLSLGWLGTYCFGFVAGLLVVGLVGAGIVVGLGLDLSGSDPRPQAVLVALAHAVALGAVWRGDVRLRPRPAADSGGR